MKWYPFPGGMGRINIVLDVQAGSSEREPDNPIDYHHSRLKFYETCHPDIKSKLTPYNAIFEN